MNNKPLIYSLIILVLVVGIVIYSFSVNESSIPIKNGGNTPVLGNSELVYTPVKCINTPWEDYYASGNLNFITEPSDEELIKAYYSSEYNVEVLSFRKDEDRIVCEACEVCERGFDYYIIVNSSSIDILKSQGWFVVLHD